jgi:isoleucyl-tRNA synthetase
MTHAAAPTTPDDDTVRQTVFLPKTDFPMRGNLPEREPEMARTWVKNDLYSQIRERSKGREKFILHIGPPYANGAMHLGHAINNTLKDVINKSWQMMGYDAPMVMGWDCHGLPIEWKIEEKYRASGQDKDTVDPVTFRAECRTFAQHWVDVQTDDLQRLGVVGDFKNPYLTMTNHAEARIAGEIHKFLLNGGLYRGVKPVMWSVVEKTALAEAEVEYKEHKSITVWIAFPVITGAGPVKPGAKMVIWTTTPWTLPSNRGIAFGPEMEYAVYTVTAVADDARARVGDQLVLSTKLADDVRDKAKITAWTASSPFKGSALAGMICAHPLRGQGYDFDVKVIPGAFVTDDTGTGFVHMAPAHGMDDYYAGLAHGLEVTDNVDDAGVFRPHVPLFAGKPVFTDKGEMGDANFAVIKAMDEVGALLAKGTLKHEYPHSWRSKAPIMYRTTPQWFISMDKNDLRAKALAGIKATQWHPAAGENRIASMIEQRPDWCISRQRVWGVPLAFFVNKDTNEPLNDPKVLARTVELFMEHGGDAWWKLPSTDFLQGAYDPDQYIKVMDTVDVWFDSGSTHAHVLRVRPELKFPADLYLEGSDQHRGWFHTSLLISCGTNGVAPYKNVLTHGFILDEKGYKMSKSMGNGIEPQEVFKKYGADILRLWAMTADYTEDVRLGINILNATTDMYRRIRNTFRFLLGALDGFDATEQLSTTELTKAPELERYILHLIADLDAQIRADIQSYNYNKLMQRLHHFCAVDLSAFYFDIRKDRLYCDRPDLFERRATRTVMAILLEHLCTWFAPVLSFTAEEAWAVRPATMQPGVASIHLTTFPNVPTTWANKDLAQKWARVRDLRRVITGALEPKRADKTIGSSLEAAPLVYVNAEFAKVLAGLDLAEIAITSAATVHTTPAPGDAFTLADVPGVAVVFAPATGKKCARCWKILPTVGDDPDYPDLSPRDADAVRWYVKNNVI